MKRFHPSPALVISVIALFVALGGTSYAAMTLPKNSVGTKQIKNGAVTAAKLNSAVLKPYLAFGSTLPSGKTEIGDWGFGSPNDTLGPNWSVFSYSIPLATGLDADHAIFVSGASATHCSGAGQADPGYLCVYDTGSYNAETPDSTNIYDPEQGIGGAGKNGFMMALYPSGTGGWFVTGTYAVTAP